MSKKPSLEPEDHVELDQASGTTIRRTVYKRGLLQTETIRYDNAFVGLSALAKKDPRKDFEDLLARARAILREAQLPTDECNGEILLSSRPNIATEQLQAGVQDLTISFACKDWSKIVQERTEPLSRERAAVAVIKRISAILQKNPDRAMLKLIWGLMKANHHFEMLTRGINEDAVSAQEAAKARRMGPQARANNGKRIEAIVREVAIAYWKRMPLHRDNMDQTASGISNDLENHLKAEGLRPIRRSRILHYLRRIRDSEEQAAEIAS